MEQRYQAVMEVIGGAPVTDVARRYGVSRQAVHLWLGKYKTEGLSGLADHSHRPGFQPRQLDAGIEAMICQLRNAHPRWGPRRLQFLSDWLARDPGRLGASLEEFIGNPAYGLGDLRGDLDRFTFLLGGSDGESLFSPPQ